jgi:polyphenol oxidase
MQNKSRRGFIRQTVALGSYAMTFWMDAPEGMAQGGPECTLPTPAAPVQFVPNEPKVVKRYSAAELGQAGRATELANLRKGIGAVRAMPQNDVRGWTKQIAQHCIDCARPNSNNVHWNWQFVPWHRAMLYFLERIMRSQTGVDDIRLCYWDWENPASRVLPAIYAPSGQSLYWANRSSGKPNWPLSDDDVDVQPALSVPTFTLFGGTAVQRSPTPIAYSGPHASVHNAFAPGDMADLQYSPRDPVFYAHHSNIDRLWSSWVAAGHSNPDFKDAKVYFYDEKSVWRYVLMNDVRDEKKLGYQYSSLMRSASTAPANLRLTSMRRTNAASLQMEANEVAAVAAKPQTPRFLLASNIQGLDKFSADTTRFGVFDVNPAVGTDSHNDKGFLGKFSRVLSSGHEHETGPLSAALNVTGKLTGAVAANKGSLNLVVAPLDANGKTTAAGIPLGADDVSIVE